MLGLSRFSKVELSEILKIWVGFVPRYDYEVIEEFNVVAVAEFTIDVPDIKRQYGPFYRNYQNVLKERGSDYFDRLKGHFRKPLLGILVSLNRGDNWSYKTKCEPIYNFVHIMELPLEYLPLYLNSPEKRLSSIAAKRLEYGK